MSRSYKSGIVLFMSTYFKRPFIEPNMHIQKLLSNLKGEFDINWLRIASSMYWTGMDESYWEIITTGMSIEDQLFITSLRKSEANTYYVRSLYIFTLLYKYYLDNKLEFKSRFASSKFIEKEMKLYPPRTWFSYSNLEDLPFDQKAWKDIYQDSDINTPIRRRRYFVSSNYFYIIDDKIKYGHSSQTTHPEKAKTLQDLGTMRILDISRNNTPVIICWYKNIPYELETVRNNDIKSYNYNNEIFKKYLNETYTIPGKVIELIGRIRIINKNSMDFKYNKVPTMYVYRKRPKVYGPVNLSFDNWGKTRFAQMVIRLQCLKYIFGFSDKNKDIILYEKENKILMYVYINLLEESKRSNPCYIRKNLAKKYNKSLHRFLDKIEKDHQDNNIILERIEIFRKFIGPRKK